MRNIESVARSFEKTADELNKLPLSGPNPFAIIALRARMRERAAQVRNGQIELDRAKKLLAESARESR